nr:MAG TPA: hypothetical protein [Caudoviricetes sp.]
MAYTKKFCQPVRMASQFVATELQHVALDAEVADGTLVTIEPGTFVADAVYSAAFGSTNAPAGLQVRKAVPTTAATAEDVFIIDIADVPTKSGQGMTIREGNLVIGLVAEAGQTIRARHLNKYDTFVVGIDNVTTTPENATKGNVVVADADGGFTALAAAAGTEGFVGKIVDVYTVSQGVDATTLGTKALRIDVVKNAVTK